MYSLIRPGRLLTAQRSGASGRRRHRPAGQRRARLAGQCGDRPLGRPPGRPAAAPWGALAVLAQPVLALAIAGCAGAGQASVALPRKPVIQPAAGAADHSPGLRQQVIAAYSGYWRATSEAVNSGDARRARRILAGYAPAAAIPGLIAVLRRDWAVGKDSATVHDCVDLSHAGLKDERTGRAFPLSFGSARANYYASLVRQGRSWLVSNIVPVVAPCDP